MRLLAGRGDVAGGVRPFGRQPAREQVEVALQGGERRAQLVTGDGEELLLQAADTRIGYVADHHDAAVRAVSGNRLAAGLQPTATAVGGESREVDAEGLAAGS